MNATVLIPVKSLTYAKSRLAGYLNISEREQLVVSMLIHVIEILKISDNQFTIYIVTSDPKVKKLANSIKVNIIQEKNTGHNQALTYAAKQIDQNQPLLTISADLPLVDVSDITQLFSLLKNSDVVLAPSKEETGTNAILMRKPLVVPYRFGKESLKKFITEIKGNKLKYHLYNNETIAYDVDTEKDLKKLNLK